MNVGQVFISVGNGHAYVAKCVPATKGGLTWRVAFNAIELEVEAAMAVERQRGNIGHNASASGDCICPAELAQKAIFVEIVPRASLIDVVKGLPISPAVDVLFGQDKVAWISWGTIATKGGAPIGLATVGERGEGGSGRPTLLGIFVLPRCRRRGIGSALLRATIEEAGKRGLLPLLYNALTPGGMALAQATGYNASASYPVGDGPALLRIRNLSFGVELL